jgi:hypothetical protein
MDGLPERIVDDSQVLGRLGDPVGERPVVLTVLSVEVAFLGSVPGENATIRVAMQHLTD